MSQARTSPRSLIAQALAAGTLALFASGCASPRSAPADLAPYQDLRPPERAIREAIATARQDGKRVVLDFGANWCSDSRAMYRCLTTHPRVQPLVAEHFVLVLIDVGERDGPLWDAEVVQRYGRPFAKSGIPALVVLDADGQPLTTPENNPLRDSDHRRPRKVADFLKTWAPPGSTR